MGVELRDLDRYVGKRFMAEHIKNKTMDLTLEHYDDVHADFVLRRDDGMIYYQVSDTGFWDFRRTDIWMCLDREPSDYDWEVGEDA